MSALVSVVIPCYNHGHYLSDALDSVLAQTFQDWEAIVVDDGSTDDTAAVAQRYAAGDGRIRYIHQENRGLAAARNAGIRAARGEYLAFLDADDAWEPAFLHICTAALRTRPDLCAVYTGRIFMDEAGRELSRSDGVMLGGKALRQRLWQGGFFPVHSVLARADVVRATGGFDEALTSVEDWDLWLRITERHDMAGIGKPLARYRIYSGSMSTNAERMHRNRMAVLAKRLGAPEGDSATWPNEKRRAFACAYRSAALGYIAQGDADRGWAMLAEGAGLWPDLLADLDTYYELACWDQQRGTRGEAALLDLPRNAVLVLDGLTALFARGGVTLAPYRRRAFGLAHLALAMLADQAGRWDLARGYMAHAVVVDPRLAAWPGVLRRALKLLAGQAVTRQWRTMMNRSPAGQRGD